MIRKLAVAASAWLLCAAPAWAGSFKIYEDSLGGPGVTAAFPTGIGLVADIDFDASTAEGGGLALGAAGITIIPAGDVVFMAFACQLTSGCGEVNFTPGGAGTGSLMINDPDPNPKTGLFELGDLTFDSASFGTIELAGCQYAPASGGEQTCDPFTMVQTPEPGTGALLGLALGALALARRRR